MLNTVSEKNQRVYDSFFATPRTQITDLEGGGLDFQPPTYDYWLKFKSSPNNPPILKPAYTGTRLELRCVRHASPDKAAQNSDEDSCYRAKQLINQHFPEVLQRKNATSLICLYHEQDKITFESNVLFFDSGSGECYFVAQH